MTGDVWCAKCDQPAEDEFRQPDGSTVALCHDHVLDAKWKAGSQWSGSKRPMGNWASQPEALAARMVAGLCATTPDWCLTHDVRADLGHYLDTRPAKDRGHDPISGIAYND